MNTKTNDLHFLINHEKILHLFYNTTNTTFVQYQLNAYVYAGFIEKLIVDMC